MRYMSCRTAVIVLNYNTTEDVRRCLISIERAYAKAQVLVVDNASSDRSIEGLLQELEGIHFLQLPENIGFGRGCNAGIKWALTHTDAEFVFLLNPDTTIGSDAIGLLEQCLDEHPEAGAATPKIVLMEDPTFLWYGGGDIHWAKGSARVPGYGGDPNAELANTERDVDFASGCAIMFRRSTIAEFDGFDPRYFMYEEDVELSLRLRRAGYAIRYVPRALIYHRAQGSQRANGAPRHDMLDSKNPRLAFYTYHVTRNRLLTMARHARGWDALRFWTIFPLYWTTKCLIFTAQGRSDAALAAFRGFRDFFPAVRA